MNNYIVSLVYSNGDKQELYSGRVRAVSEQEAVGKALDEEVCSWPLILRSVVNCDENEIIDFEDL